ncbi:YiiD C-terminal domain-containing protein [Candidatus Marinarcus aquaticus]|uniref:Thioesterase n=1 Tax=Candidatus Marinarcus aquaticus TaxID=2044504 RepID=A0A4Q0XTV8_9BACT|nr:YiiD C-terminal domain-containing protein [Candidatus Marinarcus aquaticus]RXJ60822.1 thioesterase [Candidatus Marinarcus aquaticus]
MIKLSLQEKLHNEIPMTKLMGLKINEYNAKELITSAPLEINVNDKGTAFGGSLNSIVTISGWSMCQLIAYELGYEKSAIMIYKNSSEFKAPVHSRIMCHVQKPSEEKIDTLKRKLQNKHSGSLTVYAQIIEKGKVCVEFEGIYIIKVKP